MYMLLGVLDAMLPAEQVRNIRDQRDGSLGSFESGSLQVAVLGRIIVVVAGDIAAPPDWSEITAIME